MDILYNYRGVSKYHFPMYLKEIEFRFNNRRDNLSSCSWKGSLVTFRPNYQKKNMLLF